MLRTCSLVAAAVSLMLLPSALAASNHTWVVDNDLADCPNADANTIQGAMALAQPGDLVLVCEGTYNEQVFIGAADSDISVKARGPLGSVVVDGQNTMIHGFELNGASGVLVEGFVVQRYKDNIFLVDANDNVIRGNETRLAWDHDGIELFRNSHRNLIEHNISHDNQKTISCGISAGGGSSNNVIRNNVVFHNANIGILLGGALLGSAGPGNVIEHNLVFDNGKPVSGASRGIGIFNAITPGSLIAHNHVFTNNAHGIQVAAPASTGVIVEHNLVERNGSVNDDDGIRIQDAPNAVVGHNDSRLNRHDGVHLAGATGARVEHNVLVDNGTPGAGNGCGIDVDSFQPMLPGSALVPSSNNTVMGNVARGHDRSGIRVRNSFTNVVANNHLKDNPGDGILLTNGDNNTVDRNQSNRNGTGANHAGIHADSTSTGNLLTANNMFQNTLFDARDEDANVWEGNHCQTDSPPGTICENG
jgi:parallel beta-helix repeat protein